MPSFRIPPALRHILPARGADVSVTSPGYAAPSPSRPSPPATNACRRFSTSPSRSSTTGTSRPAPSPSPTRSTRCWACRAGGFPRSIEGWLERIHLDDHDSTMEALSQSILGDEPFSCEYRLRARRRILGDRERPGRAAHEPRRPADEHDRRHARRDPRARGPGRAPRGRRAAPRPLRPAQPGHAGRRARRPTWTPTPTLSRSSGARGTRCWPGTWPTTSPRPWSGSIAGRDPRHGRASSRSRAT